jgi:hypothetical protein
VGALILWGERPGGQLRNRDRARPNGMVSRAAQGEETKGVMALVGSPAAGQPAWFRRGVYFLRGESAGGRTRPNLNPVP